MKHIRKFITALLLALPTAIPAAQVEQLWIKPDPAALKRWQDMRFGMFIHWGPVTLTGYDISWSRGAPTPIEKYDNLYKEFNPAKFNADEWARIAKAAGMKYMVLTTKHHDGFCLWDTKFTDYNIMHSPFQRDVVKELSAACKKQGIAFGAYYSIFDWYHPDFPTTGHGEKFKREKFDLDAYHRYALNQIKELITNYGPLLTIWCDGGQPFQGGRGTNLTHTVRELQPDILLNNRTGDGGDYNTPEQRIGGFQMDRPWESCMTLCRQWSWRPNDTMKSFDYCLRALIGSAGGDGNLLLNVGPTAEGLIEARQAERLKEIGDWLTKYGESIYGTRGGPFKPGKNVASTRKGNTVFIHILAWPADTFRLPALPAKIVKSRVLTGGNATVKQTNTGIEISVPPADRQAVDTIVALELDRPAMELQPVAVTFGESLTTGKKATASSSTRYVSLRPSRAIDGDEDTHWCTEKNVSSAWLEVDLGKPQTFDHAVIRENVSFGYRVKAFELQFKDGDVWKTFHRGTTIGENLEVKFEPVTARVVRLNIIENTGAASIDEFQLIAPLGDEKR